MLVSGYPKFYMVPSLYWSSWPLQLPHFTLFSIVFAVTSLTVVSPTTIFDPWPQLKL